MRATNAKIDLAAFGVRGIELPSFPAWPSRVNQVLRFQPLSPLVLERKARRTSSVPRASSPGLHRVVAAKPATSVRHGSDGFKPRRVDKPADSVQGERPDDDLVGAFTHPRKPHWACRRVRRHSFRRYFDSPPLG